MVGDYFVKKYADCSFYDEIMLKDKKSNKLIVYKNSLMITQMKTKHSITQNGHIFQIIHTEY